MFAQGYLNALALTRLGYDDDDDDMVQYECSVVNDDATSFDVHAATAEEKAAADAAAAAAAAEGEGPLGLTH